MSQVSLDILLLPTVCTTDSNLHSAVWNPDHSKTHDKNSETLFEIMTKWNMCLRSPVGIPTYGLGKANTQGTTIDLVWVNKRFYNSAILCDVDSDDLIKHFLDHQALFIIFNTPSNTDTTTSGFSQGRKKNWNKAEFSKVMLKLSKTLPTIDTPLQTQEKIERFNDQLCRAVVEVLNNHSPQCAPIGKHKHWWNPLVLDPLRQAASKARRQLKKTGSEEDRTAYKTAHNTFNSA